jgi:hypothetical protein
VDELWVLFIIIMMVASFVEKAAKAGKKGPPGQRPPQRRPQGRWPGAELPPPAPRPRPGANAEPVGAGPGEGKAAEMVAEDFWRELTGLPPVARPAPGPTSTEPAEAELEETWDEEAAVGPEAPPPETAPRRTNTSWEYRRPEVVHEAPVVVSLETTPPAPRERHAAFHRRLEQAPAVPAAAVVARSPQAAMLARLRKGEGLRESVILAEVFGRPRGLETMEPDR